MRIDFVVQDTGEEACGKEGDAEEGVEDAEGGAFFAGADEVGDKGFLDAVGGGGVEAIEGEEGEEGAGMGCDAEAVIDPGIDEEAEDEDSLFPDTVGEGAYRNGPGDGNEVGDKVNERDEGDFHTDLVCLDEEESIGGVAEGEDEEDGEEEPVAGGEVAEKELFKEPMPVFARFADTEDDDEDSEDGRDAGEEEDEPEVIGEGCEEGKGGEGADYGAAVVHCLLEAETFATFADFGRAGNEAVAGGGADAFAKAFEEAEAENLQGGDDEGVEGDDERGEAVADEHEGFVPANFVAPES